jgi:MFS transporter, FHS family, L-fucose permease
LLGGHSFKMGFMKRTLKVSDDEKTTAAELTLRQSIYPLCLVTILFFLWVSSDLCLL